MRLGVLDRGHAPRTKLLLAMIRVVSRHPVPDVIKTLRYRPEYYGAMMSELFQQIMRGPSAWSVGDRELMASFISKTNECEF